MIVLNIDQWRSAGIGIDATSSRGVAISALMKESALWSPPPGASAIGGQDDIQRAIAASLRDLRGRGGHAADPTLHIDYDEEFDSDLEVDAEDAEQDVVEDF